MNRPSRNSLRHFRISVHRVVHFTSIDESSQTVNLYKQGRYTKYVKLNIEYGDAHAVTGLMARSFIFKEACFNFSKSKGYYIVLIYLWKICG